MMYGNEKPCGRAILNSGLDRNDLFFTTKINTMYMGYDRATTAINLSLRESELDYIDLSVNPPSPVSTQLTLMI